MQFERAAVGERDAIDHRGRRGDQVEVELAGQPLLHDLQMQEPEESAAETEAERGGGLRLVAEGGVVETQLADRGAQVLEIRRIDRKDAAEDHRHRRAEAGQRRRGRPPILGDGVADRGVGDLLDRAGEEAELARSEHAPVDQLRREDADRVHFVDGSGPHHADLHAFLELAVDDAHQHDDAEIGVVPGIDQKRLQRRVGVAGGRRQPGDDGFQHRVDALAGLG